MAQIFVNVVIDTKYLKKNYPNPSKDKNNPTGVNHNSQFMIVDGEHVISGQGTADLHIQAAPGDQVYFTGNSIESDSSDAVIIYGLPHWKGDEVMSPFMYIPVELNGAVQPIMSDDGLPPELVFRRFMRYQASVIRSGTEWFYVRIAVYEQQGSEQVLFGYYKWDPAITA